MAVKLSRYVFKRIRGRIVPIRVGSKPNIPKGKHGRSMQALRKRQGKTNKHIDKKVSKHLEGSIHKKPVYHGTDAKFDKFDHDKIGSSVGTASGRGFYFTKSKFEASGYGKNVGKFFINIKNPIKGSLNKGFPRNLKDSEIRKIIKSYGSRQDTWSNWMNSWPPSISGAKKEFFNSLKKYSKDDVDIINSPISDLGQDPKVVFDKLRKTLGIDSVTASNKSTKHFIVLNSDQIMKAPKRNKDYSKIRKLLNKRRKQ